MATALDEERGIARSAGGYGLAAWAEAPMALASIIIAMPAFVVKASRKGRSWAMKSARIVRGGWELRAAAGAIVERLRISRDLHDAVSDHLRRRAAERGKRIARCGDRGALTRRRCLARRRSPNHGLVSLGLVSLGT